MVYGNYLDNDDYGKRPLSKLTRDILLILGYTSKNKSPLRKNTDDELLEILKEKAKAKGGVSPTYDELRADSKIPNPKSYISHFGTFNNALRLADLNSK